MDEITAKTAELGLSKCWPCDTDVQYTVTAF